MLVRISPRFVSFGLLALSALALSTTACSSLTRPDEIAIVAEPPAPAPTLRQLPPMPAMAPGGAVLGGAARAPAGSG